MIDPLEHQGLVHAIALKLRHSRVSMDDLVSAGQLGLLYAIKNFSPDRGVKFATYAFHAVHREVSREADRHRHLLHIPADVFALARGQKNQRAANRKKSHIELAKQALRRPINERSLGNDPRRKGKDLLLADLAPNRGDHIHDADSRLDAESLLQRLSPRQAEVVRLVFGFDGAGERDHPQVGEILCCSHQNVQQLLRKSLAKLREAGRRSA